MPFGSSVQDACVETLMRARGRHPEVWLGLALLADLLTYMLIPRWSMGAAR